MKTMGNTEFLTSNNKWKDKFVAVNNDYGKLSSILEKREDEIGSLKATIRELHSLLIENAKISEAMLDKTS